MRTGKLRESLTRSRLTAEIVNALLEETRELRLPQEYIEHNLVPRKGNLYFGRR